MTKSQALVLCCVFIGWIAGCGGSSPDAYSGPVATVTGKVTLEGKPVPKGCRVVFQGTEKSFLATGIVESDGKYHLQFKGSRSVPAIKYVVTISPPLEPTSTKPSNAAAAAANPVAATPTNSKAPVKSDGPIPSKYGSISSSGLTYTIEKGSKPIDIDLKP